MEWGDHHAPRSRGTGLRAWASGAAYAAALCLAAPALAANPPITATATGKAVVVAPGTLVKTGDLDFGRIAATSTIGTVTMDPSSGLCTTTGTILRVGTCTAATFAGKGTTNFGVRITNFSSTNLTGPGGATMVLDNLVLGTNATITFTGNGNGNGGGLGLINGNGNQRYTISTTSGIYTLAIGGTLHVGANQAPGDYLGTISLTIQYQ